jgi:hypothetical protein
MLNQIDVEPRQERISGRDAANQCAEACGLRREGAACEDLESEFVVREELGSQTGLNEGPGKSAVRIWRNKMLSQRMRRRKL